MDFIFLLCFISFAKTSRGLKYQCYKTCMDNLEGSTDPVPISTYETQFGEDEFRTVKTQLKYILLGPGEDEEDSVFQRRMTLVQNAVIRHNTLVIVCYQFIRAFILNCYDNIKHENSDLPIIDSDFISLAFKAILNKNIKRGNPDVVALYAQMINFSDTFKNHLPKNLEVSGKNLSHVLKYTCNEMATAYSNNIKMNFPSYIKRLIYTRFNLKKKRDRVLTNNIFNDLVWGSNKIYVFHTSEGIFREWIRDNIRNISGDATKACIRGYIHDKIENSMLDDSRVDNIVEYLEIHDRRKYKPRWFPKWLKKWVNKQIDQRTYQNLSHDEIKRALVNDHQISIYLVTDIASVVSNLEKDMYHLKDNLCLAYKYKSPARYHHWINIHRPLVLPTLSNKGMYYDLKAGPFKFLKPMIYINLRLEKMKVKLFQPLPLRNSNVPCHMQLDTSAIVDILADREYIVDNRESTKLHNKAQYFGKIKVFQEKFWSDFFGGLFRGKYKKYLGARFGKTCARRRKERKRKQNVQKKYVFNNMITTNGYEVALLQTLKKNYGKTAFQRDTTRVGNSEFKHLSKLNYDELEALKDHTLIGGDPGRNNLLQLVNENGDKLSYTSMQRRFETKAKQNKQRADKLMSKSEQKDAIRREQNELSMRRSKTCHLDSFLKFVKSKHETTNLAKHYGSMPFRKMAYTRHMATKESEARLVENIKKKFGVDGKPITILYGDWSRTTHMKHTRPVPGKGLRKMLGKHVGIVLTGERNTSKLCCACENILKKFMKVDDPRPWKDGTIVLHALLRCENMNCRKVWNRDVNGAVNILRVGKYYIYFKLRPKKFRTVQ